MKIIYLILFIIKFTFVLNFEFNTPFYLKSNEKYLQVKHSVNTEIQIITFNSSETPLFTLETAGKSFKSFNIPTEKNKYKVLLFPQLKNPYVYDIPNEISMEFLCKFYYPLSSVGNSDNYTCNLFYLSKNDIRISVGSCKLNLLATSCFCTVTAAFQSENIKNISDLLILAVVSKCNCQDKSKKNWQEITSSNLTLNLNNTNKLLWVNIFHGNPEMIVLIGLPRYSINKDNFQLPIKIIKSPDAKGLTNISIRFKTNVDFKYEILNSEEFGSIIDIEQLTIENVDILSIKILDSSRDLKKLEVLLVMKLQIKTPVKRMSISFYATEDNSSQMKNDFHLPDNIPKFNLTTFNDEILNVVPVIDRPLLVKNLENNRTPYILKKEVLQLYYLYDTHTTDVVNKLQCHSLKYSKLRCPLNTKSFEYDNLDLIENKDTLEWTIAVKVEDWISILDIKPQIIYENVYEITIPDHVLNEIDGWMGFNKTTSSTTLVLANKCSMIYQVTPFKVYRKVTMYKEIDSNPIELMVDITKKIELKNVRVTPNIATIFPYGNHLMIQGNREGDFQLEIIDNDDKILISKNLKVSNNPVKIKDIEVTCISLINVTLNSKNFSFLINIHNITIDFEKFNRSIDCLILIDLIFNDTSRINLLTFPKQHYSIKFITNKKIIEMDNDKDMFYNYIKFNNETSFTVEIKESNGCKNSQLVFKKYVHLEKEVVTKTSISATSSIYITATNTSAITNTSSSSIIHIIVYSLCVVIIVILLIVFFKCLKSCRRKKKLRYHLSARRKSGQKNLSDSQEKIEFGSSYPPLLPSPGPEVGIGNNMNVALSSPQSFWCLNYNNNNNHSSKKQISPAFTRQFSLPVKGFLGRDSHKYAQPCPPLRWIQKIMPNEIKPNVYSSQEALDTSPASNPCTNSPMCWSVVQMEGDQSSGIGSLMTNMDEFLKDPYELKDRFSRLSEIPRLLSDRNETVYEAI